MTKSRSDVLMSTNSKFQRTLDDLKKLKARQNDRCPDQDPDPDPRDRNLSAENSCDCTPDTKRDPVEVNFVENVTLDQARIMFGIVGMQGWQRAAGVKANVRGNQFGNEMKFFAGIADASVAKAVFA